MCLPIFVKIGQGALVWRGVEFWPFLMTRFVAFKTLAIPCECVIQYELWLISFINSQIVVAVGLREDFYLNVHMAYVMHIHRI